MKNKSVKVMLALLLTCSVAMLATGCDKLKKEPETEIQTEVPTEVPTEAPTETEIQTEAPTETEPPTEAPTEPETFAKDLTVDEEMELESEFDQLRTLYAMDDINIRTQPGTDGEIFDSFDQGERVTIIGETANWYKVDVDNYDIPGYVSKQFMSEEEVAPKTEEEREQLANETTTNATAASASTGSSDIDLQYNVEVYAESFPIQATTGANLRSTPTQDGEIIGTVASGSNVTAIGYTDRWYKVEVDGTVGYVNKNLFAAE